MEVISIDRSTRGGQKGVRANVPEGYYLRTDVARLTGVSVSTLIRWHKIGHLEPDRYQKHGSLRVWLYSEAQVEALLHETPYQKTGRPPKEQEPAG